MSKINILKQTSVKLRLTVIAISVFFVVSTILLLSFYQLHLIKEHANNIAVANRIQIETIGLHNRFTNMSESKRTDSRFYRTGESEDLKETELILARIQNLLEGLSDDAFFRVYSQNNEKDSLIYAMSIYKEHLDAYNTLKRKQGNQKYGLVGEINADLEKVRQLNTQSLTGATAQQAEILNMWVEKILYANTTDDVLQYKNKLDQMLATLKDQSDQKVLWLKYQEIDKKVNFLAEQNTQITNKAADCRQVIRSIETGAKVLTKDMEIAYSQEDKKRFVWLTWLILLLMAITAAVIGYIVVSINRPLIDLQDYTERLAQGHLPAPIQLETKDEMSFIAQKMGIFVEHLRAKQMFSDAIGRGDFGVELEVMGSDDVLGLSLVNMRNSLKEARNEEEQRHEEDSRRNWMSQGIAKFSQLLSSSFSNINDLSDKLLRELIHYMGAAQGGVYILKTNEQEPYLEMLSMYAYDRHKSKKLKIEMGEGLVGVCAKEKKPTIVSDVPEGYAEIGSAYGFTPPVQIVLTPIMVEDRLFGVIELGMLHPVEPYKMETLIKISENFAGVLWRLV